MFIHKVGGRVIGAKLTCAEKKAMQIELQKELAEYEHKHLLAIDAIVLWQLHVQLGFGKKRLERFYRNFKKELDSFLAMYEMENSDAKWICTNRLKEIGVDLKELEEKTHYIMGNYTKEGARGNK